MRTQKTYRILCFTFIPVFSISFLILISRTVRHNKFSTTFSSSYHVDPTKIDAQDVQNNHNLEINNIKTILSHEKAIRELKEEFKKLKEGLRSHSEKVNNVSLSPSIENNLGHEPQLPRVHSAAIRNDFTTSKFSVYVDSTQVIIPDVRVEKVSCAKLFAGDKNETARAITDYIRHKIDPAKVGEMAKNCENFIRDRQYILTSLSGEERDYSIAFSIVMFDDVDLFERLLRAIYRPQNHYCVHVDLKSSKAIRTAVKDIVSCFPNVFLASRLINVSWGTFSVIEAELICMDDLIKRSKAWRYFINLTGQEFPLKTNWELVRILKVLNGSNNMEGTIKRRDDTRLTKRPPLPVPIRLTKGSVHIVVSRAFVEYVLYNKTALTFRSWVNGTYVPDETFFTSLNHSPHLGVPGAYKGVPETDTDKYMFIARFKNWGDGPFNWTCNGKRVRWVCIFGVGDLPLLASRPELFANKFYTDYQSAALDCMEELHYNRTRDEVLGLRKFDTSFYEKLSFINNHV